MYVYVVCCAVLTVWLTEGRLLRTKRGACEHGTYQHEGNTCCLCPIGYRVLNHCTQEKKEQNCMICEDNTFIDHINSDDKCHPCKVCDSSANMEVKARCTQGYNTVCRCKESFYCEKNDNCVACSACDKCQENGVKINCTETSNTVCHDAKVRPQSTSTGKGCFFSGRENACVPRALLRVIIAVFAVILLTGVGGLVFFLRKKRKLCFKDKKYAEPSKEGTDLIDVDLNPHLSKIADVLGWKRMKNVAQRSGMSKIEIEEHELNHPNDVRQQTYDLLQAWYQSQGLHGAYSALIDTLRSMKENRAADEIQEIVKKEAIPKP